MALGRRDTKILWDRAGHKCENPICKKPLGLDEMQVGHKIAGSKGGSLTLKTAVCLCWPCNNKQGTRSWTAFLKLEGVRDEKTEAKKLLKRLKIKELNLIAKKKFIKIKGRAYDEWGESYPTSPTKAKYVNALSKVLSEKEIEQILTEIPQVEKKKRKRRSSDDW